MVVGTESYPVKQVDDHPRIFCEECGATKVIAWLFKDSQLHAVPTQESHSDSLGNTHIVTRPIPDSTHVICGACQASPKWNSAIGVLGEVPQNDIGYPLATSLGFSCSILTIGYQCIFDVSSTG